MDGWMDFDTGDDDDYYYYSVTGRIWYCIKWIFMIAMIF